MLQNRVSDAIYLVLFKQRISRIYLRILLVLAVLCNLIMEFKFNIIVENFKVYFLLYVNRDCGGLLKRVCNTQFFMEYFAFALVELEFNEVWNLVSYSKRDVKLVCRSTTIDSINLIALCCIELNFTRFYFTGIICGSSVELRYHFSSVSCKLLLLQLENYCCLVFDQMVLPLPLPYYPFSC